MTVQNNGSHVRGRAAPDWPTFTTTAGYTFRIRRLGPDRIPLIRQAAIKELFESCPAVPTERVPIGPDQWTELPNENNEDYRKAKAAWDNQVYALAGRKVVSLLGKYVIVDQEDVQAVQDYRALMDEIGTPVPESETDREVWLWRIACPDANDVTRLIAFATNTSLPSQEAIQAQKNTFRGDVSGA